jgi:hypothetical protein
MCSACGEVHEVPHRCGLKAWCSECAQRWGRDRTERLTAGLARRERECRQLWSSLGALRGLRPELRLLTLTVPRHEHGPVAAMSSARNAWNAMRTWLWTEVRAGWARRLKRKRRDVPAEWVRMPYGLAWEMTDGTDGAGHAHAHVVVFLPFVSVTRMNAAWHRMTGGNVHLSKDERGRVMTAPSVKTAASYLAKYVTKGGADSLSPENHAAWVRATHGRRVMSASRGLLAKKESASASHCCNAQWSVSHHRPAAPPVARGPPSVGEAAAPAA